MIIPQSTNREKSLAIFFLSLTLLSGAAKAQEPAVNGISVGLIVGDPLGGTMKYQFARANAFDVGFGPDYFGSPRLQIDYVWEFNVFHSTTTSEYAGPGLAVAFGRGIRLFFNREPHHESFANEEDNGFGFGGRTIFGMNYTPLKSRIEYFVEAGPLVGINHIFDFDLDAAIGVRYKL